MRTLNTTKCMPLVWKLAHNAIPFDFACMEIIYCLSGAAFRASILLFQYFNWNWTLYRKILMYDNELISFTHSFYSPDSTQNKTNIDWLNEWASKNGKLCVFACDGIKLYISCCLFHFFMQLIVCLSVCFMSKHQLKLNFNFNFNFSPYVFGLMRKS